jgi:hypothetical protein
VEFYVVEDYQRWAERGYCQKLACPEHYYIDPVFDADPRGLFGLCPVCRYRIDIDEYDYAKLERLIKQAERLFAEQ